MCAQAKEKHIARLQHKLQRQQAAIQEIETLKVCLTQTSREESAALHALLSDSAPLMPSSYSHVQPVKSVAFHSAAVQDCIMKVQSQLACNTADEE